MFFGDAERLLARLYPYRGVVGIGLVLLVAALTWFAWRQGWHRLAQRQRRRMAIGTLIGLMVLVPLSWVLLSPLWTRSELIEVGPMEVAAAGAEAATIVAQGSFRGADEFHFGRGTVALVAAPSGESVLRLESFSVRNGPDLHVYLSPDPAGYAGEVLDLGPLQATDGSFNVPIPAGVDLERYQSVLIWCDPFAVLFAVAPLAAA